MRYGSGAHIRPLPIEQKDLAGRLVKDRRRIREVHQGAVWPEPGLDDHEGLPGLARVSAPPQDQVDRGILVSAGVAAITATALGEQENRAVLGDNHARDAERVVPVRLRDVLPFGGNEGPRHRNGLFDGWRARSAACDRNEDDGSLREPSCPRH